MTEPIPEPYPTDPEKLGQTLFGESWTEISRWWKSVITSLENETR